MRSFFVVILGTIFLACPGFAQEDNIMTATSALQDVLSTLQQSVIKLAGDNDQLASKDKYIKAQVLQLQMQLGRLEAQGDVLNKAVDQLQEKNSRRSEQISKLEQENGDLDNRIQKAQDGIKLSQQSLDEGYQEDQKLLLQLKGTQNILPPPNVQSPESQAAERHQKEKLKLMKMIYDSQQRQASLQESILVLQKSTPILPAASALAHQQLLKEQIKDLESHLSAYQTEEPGLREQSSGIQGDKAFWDNTQLHQLELELKALEKNYLQLKDLMEQMSKKAQDAKLTVSQHVEGEKLQSNINDLNHQGQGLMADLDDLRAQMVDLDKRKSRLEMMIKQLP